MKKLLYLVLFFFSISLVACLDTEEKIEVNADNSGTYHLTIDMGEFMQQVKTFAPKEADSISKEKKDTTIYFKSYADTAASLTRQEKAILHEAFIFIHLDDSKNEMKFSLTVPFKNTATDLPVIKDSLFIILNKIDAVNKTLGNNNDNPLAQKNAVSFNPAQSAYRFSVKGTSFSYNLTGKVDMATLVGGDSTLQMIKQMAPIFGDVTYKTIYVLPQPVKTYQGNNATLSTDKKTVSFSTTLTEMLDKPDALIYKLSY
jgi:hypothetical protein